MNSSMLFTPKGFPKNRTAVFYVELIGGRPQSVVYVHPSCECTRALHHRRSMISKYVTSPSSSERSEVSRNLYIRRHGRVTHSQRIVLALNRVEMGLLQHLLEYPKSVTAALVLLQIFVRQWLQWRSSARARSGLPLPPGPKGYPIIGNMFDIPSTNPEKAYAAMSKQYGVSQFISPFQMRKMTACEATLSFSNPWAQGY